MGIVNPTSQAVIAIRGPKAGWPSWGSFVVRIDGHRTGKVKQGKTGEFTVEAGTHIVVVTMDLVRSRPFRAVVEPGARIELAVLDLPNRLGWWRDFWPVFVALGSAQTLIRLIELRGPGQLSWWVQSSLVFALSLVLMAVVALVTNLFFRDYWVRWALVQVGQLSHSGTVRG
jgi:hypothetical protein